MLRYMGSDTPDVPELPSVLDPDQLADLEKARAQIESLLNSPATQAALDAYQKLSESSALDQAAKLLEGAEGPSRALRAAVEGLNEARFLGLDKRPFDLPHYDFPSLADLPPPADVQAVAVLHEVHAELQGMAAILN